MANRYFVLAIGNNNWSSTGTWSANSNGTPTGASIPTAADAVMPSTSIATGATLTVDTYPDCLSMDWTGAINSPTLALGIYMIYIYGNLTLISAMTITGSVDSGLIDWASTGTQVWTFNNPTVSGFSGRVENFGNGGILSLGSALYVPNSWVYFQGGAKTNGYAITGKFIQFSGVTLDITNSTINCNIWSGSYPSLTSAGSTINVNTASIFGGGGNAYNIVNLTASGIYTIVGSNSFAQLNGNSSVTQTIKFTDGTTTTITDCSLSGSAGHVHTLTGTSTAGWTITKSGGRQVFVDFINLSYSAGSPNYTWVYGVNSIYGAGNSGWINYLIIAPSGIPSSEMFGNPSVFPGAVFISPQGIQGQETFGNALVIPGPVYILLAGIGSGEAFGNPLVYRVRKPLPRVLVSRIKPSRM